MSKGDKFPELSDNQEEVSDLERFVEQCQDIYRKVGSIDRVQRPDKVTCKVGFRIPIEYVPEQLTFNVECVPLPDLLHRLWFQPTIFTSHLKSKMVRVLCGEWSLIPGLFMQPWFRQTVIPSSMKARIAKMLLTELKLASFSSTLATRRKGCLGENSLFIAWEIDNYSKNIHFVVEISCEDDIAICWLVEGSVESFMTQGLRCQEENGAKEEVSPLQRLFPKYTDFKFVRKKFDIMEIASICER